MPDATPDTVAYLILALAVVAIIAVGYVASIALRYRSLQKDLQVMEQLRDVQQGIGISIPQLSRIVFVSRESRVIIKAHRSPL